MRAYLAVTGTLFALITLAHLWRMAAETALMRDPWYLLLTVLAAVLGGWAFRLLRHARTRAYTHVPGFGAPHGPAE